MVTEKPVNVGWKAVAGVLGIMVLSVASYVGATALSNDSRLVAIEASRWTLKDAYRAQIAVDTKLWDLQQQLTRIEDLLRHMQEKESR